MRFIIGSVHSSLFLRALALSGHLYPITQHYSIPPFMALPSLCEASDKIIGSKQGKGNRAMQRQAQKRKQKLRAKKVAKGAKNRQ